MVRTRTSGSQASTRSPRARRLVIERRSSSSQLRPDRAAWAHVPPVRNEPMAVDDEPVSRPAWVQVSSAASTDCRSHTDPERACLLAKASSRARSVSRRRRGLLGDSWMGRIARWWRVAPRRRGGAACSARMVRVPRLRRSHGPDQTFLVLRSTSRRPSVSPGAPPAGFSPRAVGAADSTVAAAA